MAYKIRQKKAVQENVRKIAREQIKKAISEIDDEQLASHKTIHQLRKRCKKLRGLIRLVRPEFADYSKENVFIRDMARDLSVVRDAQSSIDSLDLLAEHFKQYVDNRVFAIARDQLVERRRKITENSALVEKKIDKFHRHLLELRQRAQKWHITGDGFPPVAGGLRKTYRRGRKAMARAYNKPSAENFHDWRKRVKYHWYHIRLLGGIWPEMMEVQKEAASELADLLGDEHDLAVLAETLGRDIDSFGGNERVNVLLALMDRRRRQLQAKAIWRGERFFVEDDDHLAARFGAYWEIWQASKVS